MEPGGGKLRYGGAGADGIIMRLIKRILDLVLALTLIILAAPIMAVIVVSIYIDSSLPVLYKAKRVGKNGREFILYKFRTMVLDADTMLDKLSHMNLGKGFMIKIPNDPRGTRVGCFLRKYSLDELPQLWNV